ncbi:MAG: HU family DNA-binding protein [Clostridia bacterium]|nr:HU family DNA-binding protein [Clostridia bacterium]MBR2972988.1 HU family DNA-binding protein [Clostridia bacterium]
MNKADLVASIAAKAGLTKKDAEAALNAVVASIEEALVKGDKVALVGFGTFETKTRAARTGINPRTKQAIKIPASKVPAFKISKALKDKVAGK